MVRVIVRYEQEGEPERYGQHIEELVPAIPATFRHVEVFASRTVEGQHRYHDGLEE